MKKTKDERLLDSLDYIDEKFIAGAEKYYNASPADKIGERFAKRNRMLKIAVAVAACLALLAVAVPTATIVIEHGEYTPPTVGAENSGVEVESSPEHDGSKGLIYEVNEDGKTVSFVSFGTCTDEVVYIASTYNGMPVTVMKNQPYSDAEYIPAGYGFGSTTAKRIVVSDTVESIYGGVFDMCLNLESIYFGANFDYLKPVLFRGDAGSKLTSIEVSPDNKNFSGKGNCLVDLRTKELVFGITTTVIPDDGSVEIIGFCSFKAARYTLTSIVIPEGVKIIDHDAFAGCMALESVKLPDSLEVVEGNAFHFCQKLKKLELGKNLKAFSLGAFSSQYCPEIYYKGTTEEWEAVIKTRLGKLELTNHVVCTDGESKINAGKHGVYNWFVLPEYEAYWNKHWPDTPQPDWDPKYAGEEMTVN